MSHAVGRGRPPAKDRTEGRLSRTAARRSAPRKIPATPSKPPTSLERLQTTAGNRAVEALVRAAWLDRAADVIAQAAVGTVVGPVLGTMTARDRAVTGERDPDDRRAEIDRDTVLEGIGIARGAVLQVTDIADSSASTGGMHQKAKEAAVDATLAWARRRDLPTPSREAALNIVNAATKELSGIASIEGLAANSDINHPGLVDPDGGKPSPSKLVGAGFDAGPVTTAPGSTLASARQTVGKPTAASTKKSVSTATATPTSPTTITNTQKRAVASRGTPTPKNSEPIVWVNTGKGTTRGTYYPEGSRYFGKTRSGVAMPLSEAQRLGFRPAGKPHVDTPIEPRRKNRRQIESRGAGPGRGARVIAATSKTGDRFETAIRPDLANAHAYNRLLDRGEVGLQRPLGSSVAGVDAITAQFVYDAKGRPIDAKIFLNDVTTPDTLKGPKASHAAWHREMLAALGKRLDLGDPAAEAVLRKAAAQGNVFTRIVRVGHSATGRVELSIRPAETRRFGARSAPSVFARLARVAHEDEEGLP